MRLCVSFLAIWACVSWSRELVVEIPTPLPSHVREAVSLGLSLDDVRDGVARGIIKEELLGALRQRFPVTIVAHDVRDLLPSLQLPDRGEYHNYNELTADLQSLAAAYPALCRLHALGTSVQGRTIWALEITDNPDVDEFEPEVRLIGAHHGNETISVEVPLGIAHYLLEQYATNPQVASLVNEREIWIIPMMNPDGVEAGSRYNANGVDLNRNYGYMREDNSLSGAYSQPETRAIRDNALQHNFCLSLSYHSGALYVNYLWNYTPVRTPDDAYIVALSQAYNSYVNYGITEGYDWYQTKGDCNDWSYGTYGGMDWTIEVSSSYEPPQSQIDPIVNLNRPAILDFISRAIQGIGGIVTDATTGQPLAAMVNIAQIDWPVFCQLPLGDYHRPLPPGTYTLVVSHPGYQTQVIPNVQVTSGQRTVVHVALVPSSDSRNYARRVVSANSTNYNGAYPYPTHAHDALGPPDGQWFSLGKNGWVVLDAGVPFVDGPGPDLMVYEAGSDGDEGYSLYVGSAFNGPWVLLGTAFGTASFDLASAGVTQARYLYVKDDNVGSATVPNPGFDLDAIEIGQPPNEPNLVVASLTVSDQAQGNGNGVVDPGETVSLWITLANLWAGQATSVWATLSSADPLLVVQQANSPYPDIPGGGSGTNTSPFSLYASPQAPPGHVAALTLAVEASGAQWNLPLSLRIGQRPLLLVDSDDEPTETRVVDALAALGLQYDRWNAYQAGLSTVPLDTLRAYRVVIWLAGDQNTSSITAENRANLASYLDAGGKLLVSAENYLSSYGSDPFTSTYLHVASYTTNITASTLVGVAQDPIGDGISVTLSYPSGLSSSPDRVNPASDAAAVFVTQSTAYPVAIRYPAAGAGSYRVVFFGAPLEAFPATGQEPHTIRTVVSRCLQWLDGADTVPPTAPSGLVLALDGTLSWSPSSDNVGVHHYRVYRSTAPFFTPGPANLSLEVVAPSVSVPEGIGDPALDYFYRVTALDAAGNESAPSPAVGAVEFVTP